MTNGQKLRFKFLLTVKSEATNTEITDVAASYISRFNAANKVQLVDDEDGRNWNLRIQSLTQEKTSRAQNLLIKCLFS